MNKTVFVYYGLNEITFFYYCYLQNGTSNKKREFRGCLHEGVFISGKMKCFQFGFWSIFYNGYITHPEMKIIAAVNLQQLV